MKHRLLDVLCCPCGASLVIEDETLEKKEVHTFLQTVACESTCARKSGKVSEGAVTPGDCNECYASEIMTGQLCCPSGHKWPILDGIPRFIPSSLAQDFKKTQATFTFEWKMFRFGERNWGQDIETRRALFLKGMGVSPEQLKGKRILDAGCGSGLLSMEMAKSFGMEVFGIDLAFGIENAYRKNDNPFVHFVQGSVLELPFKAAAFDYVYCAGVLVALPDTHEGFLSIITKLKRGGRCFIWLYHPIDRVYHPNDLRKMATYNWIRENITSRLPIKLQFGLYLSLMPAFLIKQRIATLLGKQTNQRTWREKMQSLFDMFSPIYQNRHEEAEALSWYLAERFENVDVAYQEEYGFAVRGDSPL
jgi:ubiquinone/menaquinone biosynthesis C-methylase UbiE